MSNYGLWTLLPPLVVIALAIKTRKPIESLLIGCVSAYVIIAVFDKLNFIELTLDAFFMVATDYDNVWIMMVCALFGSLIALLNASHSTMAIARFIGRFCKKAKDVLLMAWVLGIVIFIDDYMNIMTISSCFKKICDEKKVPRSALAYIIDSTGAPTCVLVPFSTWAVFYAANFFEQPSIRALGYSSPMSTYMHAVPYMFYASIALVIVPLFILKVVPLIGPMKEEYARLNEITVSEEYEEQKEEGHVIDFVLPLGVMIAVTILMDDMFLALICSIVSCFILYVPRKIMSADEFCDMWVKGIGDLMPTLAVLLFAFFMKQACADIGLPAYVTESCLPYVGAKTFPMLAFVIVSILAFVTGDSWGVPAICVPIIVPLGAACGANMLLTMGAIVSGGTFCSHACFYSDATVLTSTCCEIEPMQHAKTQLPYAIIGFVISFVMYGVFALFM